MRLEVVKNLAGWWTEYLRTSTMICNVLSPPSNTLSLVIVYKCISKHWKRAGHEIYRTIRTSVPPCNKIQYNTRTGAINTKE